MSLANLRTAILGFSKHTKRLWGTSITNGLGKVLSFKEERYLKWLLQLLRGLATVAWTKWTNIVNTGEKLEQNRIKNNGVLVEPKKKKKKQSTNVKKDANIRFFICVSAKGPDWHIQFASEQSKTLFLISWAYHVKG